MPHGLILLSILWEQETDRRILAYFGVSSITENGNRRETLAALLPFLNALTVDDVRHLGRDADELARLLVYATPSERDRILRRWQYGPARDSDVAESIVRALWSELAGYHDFRAELLETLMPVALSPRRDGRAFSVGELLPRLLRDSPAPERERILRRWRDGPARNPDFAENIVRTLWREVDDHEGFRDELLDVLLPVALANSERDDDRASSLRGLLASYYPHVLFRHSQLVTAHRRDLDREAAAEKAREERRLREEQAERDRLARREAVRLARIAEIGAMPMRQRVELLMSGSVGVQGPYPDSWANVTDEDLEFLYTESGLELLQGLRGSRSRILRRLRSNLSALLEAGLCIALADTLRDMSLVGQLEHLASGGVRLGRYPLSLAYWAVEQCAEVPADLQQRVAIRLAGQHGAWGLLRETFTAARS